MDFPQPDPEVGKESWVVVYLRGRIFLLELSLKTSNNKFSSCIAVLFLQNRAYRVGTDY